MEGKVSWSAEVKTLFHSGQDDERIMFCRSLLICEDGVAFPHLLLDQLHDLVQSVFEVYMVDVDALLERAAFFLFPISWRTVVGITCFLGLSP